MSTTVPQPGGEQQLAPPRSALEYALRHARGGWPVFPVQPLSAGDSAKRPYRGFTQWEERASTDIETITAWWALDYPDAVVAIAPGPVERVCIDIDRHPGKPNGYASLVDAGVHLPASAPQRRSLSGRGVHCWFRGSVSSRNALYPGVDRKGRGGYVVAMYELPPVAEVQARLTAALHGPAPTGVSAAYGAGIGDWLAQHAGSTPSPEVVRYVSAVPATAFSGHDWMLRAQAHLVQLAAEGHGGVPEALSVISERWHSSEHRSGDPRTQWRDGIEGAIRKFGGTRD
ncbi:bifunctional DNA primase/polymerase [Demequina phytophila]|uniref:bifunctional DNA primase/polymerase n=1 Tax=Demequina phytophila TaxID=1638981 RepID=UPI0007867093|nr:bifunctional DNA primase/polymerase [Demequina phytophila]